MNRRLVWGVVRLGVALASIGNWAMAGSIVVPAGYAGVEGPGGQDTSPLGQDGTARFQQVFNSTLLGGLPIGTVLTGLTFRLDGLQATDLPAQTVANYEIRLSQSANAAGSLSMTFADNRGADEVIARSGALTINAGDFRIASGAGPAAFGPIIPFTNFYTYQGGDLLLEIAYTGFVNGRGADQDTTNTGGQQIFTFSGGPFHATTADYAETGVFIVQFQTADSAVPEPASMALVGAGLLAAATAMRRRR